MSVVAAPALQAPSVAPAVSAPIASGLKRRSLVVMAILLIVTFGLYYPAWFFRRRQALNRLDSPRKLPLWPLVLFTVYLASQFAIGVLEGVTGSEPSGGIAALNLIWKLAVSLVMLVQCFAVKDIIEDHAQGSDDDTEKGFRPRVELSGLLTFFFSIFYLQYAINKYVVAPRQ